MKDTSVEAESDLMVTFLVSHRIGKTFNTLDAA